MGKTALGWFFRFGLVLFLLSGITIFIVYPDSAEFYISLITLILNFAVALVTGIMLYRKRKK